jgi:uncharacterized membrane protein YcaP (DUF421 family)
MESIVRSSVIYVFLLILFRVIGRRTLASITTFDFVLLLVVGEATQQALLAEDYSVTNAFVVIGTLAALDLLLGWAKQRWPSLDRVVEGQPILLVVEGREVKQNLDREGIDRNDILEAARESHGLAAFDQVRFAVLERTGNISVIPY